MNEVELLKLRLENAIEGHKIGIQVYPNEETKEMLKLLEDCYSVISRIVPADEDDMK